MQVGIFGDHGRIVKSSEIGSAGRPAVIGKTEVTVLAQNEMIQQRDTEEFSALAKSLREDTIFLAGSRITGWMVMRTNAGSRVHQD